MNIKTEKELLDKEVLDQINGKVLSKVEFIADFLCLSFDPWRLQIFNTSLIVDRSDTFKFGGQEFSNLILNQVGKRIVEKQIAKEKISLIFENRIIFNISLKIADYHGPEALLARAGDQTWVIREDWADQ